MEGKRASYGGGVWLVNLKEREHLEGLGVNGKILKMELEEKECERGRGSCGSE
jgi:hypothetical protein